MTWRWSETSIDWTTVHCSLIISSENKCFFFCVFLLLLLLLFNQWDPQGSPQTNLSGPVLPPGLPFPNQPHHRTSVPDSTEGFDLNKPDPYDLYEKSRAIYESRRKCRKPWGSWGSLKKAFCKLVGFILIVLFFLNICCCCWTFIIFKMF